MLSLVLTFVPIGLYVLHEASHHQTPSHEALYAAFVVFAALQVLVQLYFFLHVGDERRPRYKALALYFAALVVVILIGGTLWIMHNLMQGHADGTPFINGDVAPQYSND
jgi:cytochrome o ubiquinol oxidase operon protein cyoD